ncbi:hypothetical protein [Spirosoma luteum]|uniref:hypothetical protein n=1 Tax=Spirosoma luteum TaxID=431553 RepID=UPI00036F3AD7|nr:hypothetical protein [Spirosoma luteum]
MAKPFDSKEYQDAETWRAKSKQKLLSIGDCISSWTDICGFGSLLEKNNWDLNNLQKNDVFHLLSEMHLIAGTAKLINIDPFPNEKIIVLNDGIAGTVDLQHIDKLHAHIFLFFFRDLLFTHYRLLQLTKLFGVGVRTILAGGQRVQYSSASTSGQSSLYYNEESISEFGERLLNTTFVYNPAEFQMNTAFAKAFTIDSLGSKQNIKVNGFYIEHDYFTKLQGIADLTVKISDKTIELLRNNILMFKLSILSKETKSMKGLEVVIYHIDKYFIYKEFDGDDLELDMFNQTD